MDITKIKENFVEGQVLLLNKPYAWTSFDLVKKVKNLLYRHLDLKNIKVGHAGTLDPLATGLMILCTGKATKELIQYQNLDKEYIATFRLGETTPSFDLETEVDHFYETEHITLNLVKKVSESFLGESEQEPPMFSAKNINGKRAYKLARKGVHTKMKSSRIRIDELELLSFELPALKLRIRCSKGTYIRALARDMGVALNSGSFLSDLVRTQIGDYKLIDALSFEDLINKITKL